MSELHLKQPLFTDSAITILFQVKFGKIDLMKLLEIVNMIDIKEH